MIEYFNKLFEKKRVCILGYGLEGKSTYKFIRKYMPIINLTILDKNNSIINDNILINDNNTKIISGNNYIDFLQGFDLIIKSPGIPSNTLPNAIDKLKITSQTDLFLQMYSGQVIGVTGTKGKSTTSSLIYHILKSAGRKALLVGNIGIPPLDCISLIDPDTVVVMEMSSHQLEYLSVSPHIGILLNLFQEHLDHYHSYDEYKQAKFNIGKYQSQDDYFLYNIDNEDIKLYLKSHSILHSNFIPISLLNHQEAKLIKKGDNIELKIKNSSIVVYNTLSPRHLEGDHNLYNIAASAAACMLQNVSYQDVLDGISTFEGLEHRIESVGEYAGILWYNDSIATIPEASIAAVKTLEKVNTLILGGNDKRKIDFHKLYEYLPGTKIEQIIFIGEAGKRMMDEFADLNHSHIKFYLATDYKQVVELAALHTKRGKICLLSPAASSYDMFRNFEERGKVFKQWVQALKK